MTLHGSAADPQWIRTDGREGAVLRDAAAGLADVRQQIGAVADRLEELAGELADEAETKSTSRADRFRNPSARDGSTRG